MISIIPKPRKVEKKTGAFLVDKDTKIYSPPDTNIGSYLRELLHSMLGIRLPIDCSSCKSQNNRNINLKLSSNLTDMQDEEYILEISSRSITMSATQEAGLFYGIQTLRQLLSAAEKQGREWKIPAVFIQDKPRYEWRGMHLDVARHMFPLDFIKQYVDLLALHKFNTFHWHLTDDQGWRIEIKHYPKLTEVGSQRTATPLPSDPNQMVPETYKGYYTQEEIKEIVAYARKRCINIVPEIDFPGHTTAALASYPHLGCTEGPYKVRTSWGIAKDILCAGKEEVYAFVRNVLDEVMELFPSSYIHIGGDEVPKDRWEQCPHCQSMIKKHNLEDENGLQTYFVKRIHHYLHQKGRKLIGWDEIADEDLPSNITIMSWRGTKPGTKSALRGHNVIMSPTSHCYFDYYQSQDRKSEPPANGGFLPLEKVYTFDPVPDALPTSKRAHILGGQGNVWTERISSTRLVEYMAFPRATALAEALWTPPELKDFDDFMCRFSQFKQLLQTHDVHYRDPYQ
jgi:hexosaminidase